LGQKYERVATARYSGFNGVETEQSEIEGQRVSANLRLRCGGGLENSHGMPDMQRAASQNRGSDEEQRAGFKRAGKSAETIREQGERVKEREKAQKRSENRESEKNGEEKD
jgi:hypothetical protein